LSLEGLAKSGAIVSSAGVGLFVAFVAVLLAFPVIKECKNESENESDCTFSSTAPEPLRSMVQPGFLAISLMVIGAGVFMVRFSRWRGYKKTESGV
jgi:hypothetical protein